MWNVYVVVDIYTQVGRIGRARPIATLLAADLNLVWCDGIESRFVACRANASKRIEKPFLERRLNESFEFSSPGKYFHLTSQPSLFRYNCNGGEMMRYKKR